MKKIIFALLALSAPLQAEESIESLRVSAERFTIFTPIRYAARRRVQIHGPLSVSGSAARAIHSGTIEIRLEGRAILEGERGTTASVPFDRSLIINLPAGRNTFEETIQISETVPVFIGERIVGEVTATGDLIVIGTLEGSWILAAGRSWIGGSLMIPANITGRNQGE